MCVCVGVRVCVHPDLIIDPEVFVMYRPNTV